MTDSSVLYCDQRQPRQHATLPLGNGSRRRMGRAFAHSIARKRNPSFEPPRRQWVSPITLEGVIGSTHPTKSRHGGDGGSTFMYWAWQESQAARSSFTCSLNLS